MAADTSVSNRFQKASVALIGIGIFALHAGVFYFSNILFNIMISLYIITYSILVIILIGRNKSCVERVSYDWLINLSIYTIFLQGFLVLFVLAMGLFRSNAK